MTVTRPSLPPRSRSSSSRSSRPSAGLTPSASNAPPLKRAPFTNCFSPPDAVSNRVHVHASPLSRSCRRRISCHTCWRTNAAPSSPFSVSRISRSGSCTGRGRKSVASISEKIAVFAPMPSASERMAAADTSGVARSARTASRRSDMPVYRSKTPVAGARFTLLPAATSIANLWRGVRMRAPT